MTKTLQRAPLILALAAGLAFGQGCGLSTPFNSNNGQSGNMFDIVALNSNGITVTGFDVNVAPGTWNFEVYTCNLGSHVGNETIAANWTMVASVNNVVSNGNDVPTPLGVTLNVPILPLATQGFYVTVANGTAINYTNGVVVGGLWASDAHVQINEGVGNPYPFGAPFSPRNWNGTVYYTFPGQVNDYQTNSPTLGFDIDNVLASACAPAIANAQAIGCNPVTPAVGSFNLSTNITGAYYDVAISAAPLISSSAGAFVLANGNVVNIDLLQPFTFLSSGGSTPIAMQFPGSGFPGAAGGSFSVPYSIGQATDLSFQAFVADPASPVGATLSQASELHVSVSSAFIPGPNTDDGVAIIDLTTACGGAWAPNGITFYGSTYTTIAVESNGRVSFGGNNATDFQPTLGAALTQNPFVGFWTDLSPQATGASITIDNPAPNVVAVNWNNVPYYADPNTVTFSVRFDVSNGSVTIDNIGAIQPNLFTGGAVAGDNIFLGMTPGAGATDPGPQLFLPMGIGAFTAATDMLYDFMDAVVNPMGGQTVSQANGVNSIMFTPAGGNYAWSAL